jgi:hypothetical protein
MTPLPPSPPVETSPESELIPGGGSTPVDPRWSSMFRRSAISSGAGRAGHEGVIGLAGCVDAKGPTG